MVPIQGFAPLDVTQLQHAAHAAGSTGNDTQGPAIFTDILRSAQAQVQATDTRAQQAVIGLLSGQGVEVHEATIATQQADLTFQLALQVRNKAVSAYQQMMQMQF